MKYTDPDGRANTLSITPSDVELFLEETKQALSSIPTPAVVCVGIASGLIVANELSDGAVFEGIADGINFIADKTIEAGKWIGEKIGGLFSKGDKEKLKSEDKQEKQSLPDMQNKPPKHPDYKPPKNWNGRKERNPNGDGTGWSAKNGNVWVPTDHNGTHSPHWDVQKPGGKYEPKYPLD